MAEVVQTAMITSSILSNIVMVVVVRPYYGHITDPRVTGSPECSDLSHHAYFTLHSSQPARGLQADGK